MRTAAAVLLAAVLAIAAGAGCTLKVTPPDDDAGAAADAAAQKVGDQCTEIFTELCSQAINRCGIVGFNLNDCVTSNMAACCGGSVCGETSQSPSSAVDLCKAAIDAEDCNEIANSATPGACQGVPQKP